MNPETVTALEVIGAISLLLTYVFYYRIIVHQFYFATKHPGLTKFIIYSIRSAVLVPGFATCFFVALVYPDSYVAMYIPEAYFQAYAVFCFFALTCQYVGGPKETLEIFRKSPHTFPSCIFKCMNDNPERCYSWAYWAHWQYIWVRPLIEIICVVMYYENYQDSYIALSGVTFLMVVWVVTGLVKHYHVLHDHCKGLNSLMKITIIKGTVGLVLGEGTIVEMIIFFNWNGNTSAADLYFVYCFIVLIELAIISVITEWNFAVDMEPENIGSLNQSNELALNFGEFMWRLMRLHDVFDDVVMKPIDSLSLTSNVSEVALTPTRGKVT